MKANLLSLRNLLTVAITIMAFTSLSAAGPYFVKPNATGTGASWDDPANISIITSGVADGDIVYVAAGSYLRTTQLSIAKYITVKGGYPANATGTDITVCDYVANKAIFSPDAPLGVTSTTRGMAINATAAPSVAGQKITLDGLYYNGFTMATGNSGTALSITTAQGNIDSKNLTFTNNVALNSNGGALYMGSFAYNITISFDNCSFTGNQSNVAPTIANGYGGACYFNNGTTNKTVNFTNCNFKNNKAYNRAAAVYYTQTSTLSFTDCTFDSNQLTNATDAASSGGCFYIAGGAGTGAVTLNATRCIFLNSNSTQYGSVIWFNTVPKHTLNMTDCSLIGNYAQRTTSARAAIDCGSYITTMGGSLTGCVLSNYNWSGGKKASNCPDLMNLASGSTDANFTFTNSILNGAYFTSSNALAAITAPVSYKTSGYLADSTIALALTGDLKITDKIVLKKTFTAANVGNFVHTQIFDVKRNTGKSMTLIADIPADYKLVVNEVDQYTAGTGVTINIAASASDPTIRLTGPITGISNASDLKANIYSEKGIIKISGLENGSLVTVFGMDGRLVSNQIAKSTTMNIPARGFVIVKIVSEKNSLSTKLFVK
jgi:hypothetical protein